MRSAFNRPVAMAPRRGGAVSFNPFFCQRETPFLSLVCFFLRRLLESRWGVCDVRVYVGSVVSVGDRDVDFGSVRRFDGNGVGVVLAAVVGDVETDENRKRAAALSTHHVSSRNQ